MVPKVNVDANPVNVVIAWIVHCTLNLRCWDTIASALSRVSNSKNWATSPKITCEIFNFLGKSEKPLFWIFNFEWQSIIYFFCAKAIIFAKSENTFFFLAVFVVNLWKYLWIINDLLCSNNEFRKFNAIQIWLDKRFVESFVYKLC